MQNLQEKRGSKWSKAVNLERILVEIGRVWAHLSAFSSSLSAKAVQNDHQDNETRDTSTIPEIFSGTWLGTRVCRPPFGMGLRFD